MSDNVSRIKQRKDFLKVSRFGETFFKRGLGLQIYKRSEEVANPSEIRIGFTASRKVGNAVQRNRAKRRLRALANEILPLYYSEGYDYVFIATKQTTVRAYSLLKNDLTRIFKDFDASGS